MAIDHEQRPVLEAKKMLAVTIEALKMYHSTTDLQPFNLSVPLTYSLI